MFKRNLVSQQADLQYLRDMHKIACLHLAKLVVCLGCKVDIKHT